MIIACFAGEEAGAVKGSDDKWVVHNLLNEQQRNYWIFVEFHDVDVRISVADSDAALDEDPPFRDDPNDLIYEPETKT